jgi:hypothetical protein
MTQKEIDEVDMFILHWAKEHKFIDPSLMELPSEGSYIILFFHIGYEEWKAMYPDKLEERTCTGEKSK